ncbi:MAG TPA: SGNH/GDSL hydrolase family protein [Trebonia sp.]|nr:SGNH/GDSL hydrolase family protein [Trebonia sp.]
MTTRPTPIPTQAASAHTVPPLAGPERWLGTWSAALVLAADSGLSRSGFRDQTIRNVIHASVGGSAVRIRLSNVFGDRPLRVDGAHVAIRLAGAATVPGTGRAVTFGGAPSVIIPAGERAWSDQVPLRVEDGDSLAVSLYVGAATGPATWHPAALSTSYRCDRGDHAADPGSGAFGQQSTSWFFLDGVDVLNPAVRGAVVAFGPSTTDGIASTPDTNGRYPDLLARRLRRLPPGMRMSVLNAGIAGNKLLADAGTSGQSALDRFLRDAAGQSGARAVILWEGNNDVATRPDLPLGVITGAYQRLVRLAHAHGMRIIGATLQPHEGAAFYSHAGNRLREAVNDWIRWSGAFDGVADFDQVLRDPRHPRRLLPGYDSGDHLHPNDAGYRAVAASVDLAALTGAGGDERVA